MKAARITVSDDTEIDTLQREVDLELPQAVRLTPEDELAYQHLMETAREYVNRAKQFASLGSTISVESQHIVHGKNITLRLEYPRRRSFLKKVFQLFNGG